MPITRLPERLHVAYLGQGQSYHVSKWLVALAEEDLDVSLITFSLPEEPLPGVTTHAIQPFFSRRQGALRMFDFWGPAAPLARLLQDIGADVLIASYGTNYGWLGMRTGFRPYIAQTWTADVTVYPWVGWTKFILRPMVRRFLREASIITTDGPALAEAARRLFPQEREKIVSVRWGIRTSDYEVSDGMRLAVRERMGVPQDAVVLNSARGLFHWHRPKVVVSALIETLEAREKAYAIVFTHGADPDEELILLLEKLRLHPRGHVVDRFLKIPEMRDIWSITDAVISVPINDGISEALLESMYAGCIPVVSHIPSNESFLNDGENAVFVSGDPDNQLDLIDTFCQVVDTMPELKSTMIPRNRTWVKNEASIEQSAKLMTGLVRQVART